VGNGWQQPVTQKKPLWQASCPASPHFCFPAGHTCSVQSAGKVVLPAQSSQCSQVLLQAAFWVHGLHFDWSLITSRLHEGTLLLPETEPR
jgi:hypothetical protein